MSDNTVSVVIPTCNRPGFLAQSLRSVLDQRDVEMEVIVVDDGSVEGSVDGVAGVRDSRVRVLRHVTSLGVCAARNAGIGAARGAWVAFLDDDDLWAPRKISAQLKALAAAPECGWCCVGVLVVNHALRIIGCERPPDRQDVAVEMLMRQAVPGGGSGVLAARQLFAVAGGFDPTLTLNGDWDMYLRLAQRSRLASVDAPLLAYRVHRASISLDVEACDREFEIIDRKYAPLRSAAAVMIDRAQWDRWRASAYLRGGRRWRSFRTLRAAAGNGAWGGLARDAVISAAPGSLRIREYRRGRMIPASWRADAQPWLASFR